MTKRKFFRTVFTIEVLSEEPADPDICLEDLAHAITEGPWSGDIKTDGSAAVNGKKMAKLLVAQGSDPSFFRLTDKGEDSEDES